MTQDITYVGFGDITCKRGDDGALFVYGKATGPDLDLDQQICDPDWLKTAMPQWLATGANVREMHNSIAAGIGLELNADGEDWYLKSEVVDDNTARKVEKKVLKGYSIGIKQARIVKDEKAPNGRIVGGQIVEVSLVDRPANPTATVEIAKAVGENLELVKGIDLEPLIPNTQQSHADSANINQELNIVDVPAAKDSDDPYPAVTLCPACSGTGVQADTNDACPVCDGSGKHPEVWPMNPEAEQLFDELNQEGESGKGADAEVEKKDYSDKQRQNLADKGQAMPDGSYPIKTVGDLKKAIQAFGRAKDKAKTKAHIKARAEALGKEDLLPESWKAVDADVVKEMEHDPDDLAAVRQSLINLIKAELDEMASGEENEVCDIYQLTQALELFLCWWEHEADENETTNPFTTTTTGDDTMAYIGLGVSADLIKSASAEDASEDTKTELRNEIRKALGVDEEIAIYKTALAEQQESVQALKAALEEVREMATPGGPVLRATQAQASKAADAERLQAEAARYKRLASEVVDPSMKAGYLAKAASAVADAERILRN